MNNKFYKDEIIKDIIKEVRQEQTISPNIKDEILISYVKEGIYDINVSSGTIIDFNEDLTARSLLKTYVLYATYKRLAEFKELYFSDYATLQAKYYESSKL